LHHREPADLIRLVGADRVLFGTDYPSPMRDARPTEFIQGLTELALSERDAILGGNAARAFRL
jgi:predicted TIM-barrel fold metal-dependent hydrolase